MILTAHPYIKHNCSQFDSDIVLFSVSLFCHSLSHKHVVQVQSTASTLTIQCRLCTFSRSMIPRDSFNTSPTITLSLPLLLPNFSTLPTYSFPMKPFFTFSSCLRADSGLCGVRCWWWSSVVWYPWNGWTPKHLLLMRRRGLDDWWTCKKGPRSVMYEISSLIHRRGCKMRRDEEALALRIRTRKARRRDSALEHFS